jgi:hypothetical protein
LTGGQEVAGSSPAGPTRSLIFIPSELYELMIDDG